MEFASKMCEFTFQIDSVFMHNVCFVVLCAPKTENGTEHHAHINFQPYDILHVLIKMYATKCESGSPKMPAMCVICAEEFGF